MHVVSHQNIGVDRATPVRRRLHQPVEVAVIILFGKEAGFPVDTALHDVLRYPGEFYAWAAWHGGFLMEKYSKLTPVVL